MAEAGSMSASARGFVVQMRAAWVCLMRLFESPRQLTTDQAEAERGQLLVVKDASVVAE